MVIRNKFINSSNQLTTLGTIIFTIIFLAFTAGSIYFIYCLFKNTKKEANLDYDKLQLNDKLILII